MVIIGCKDQNDSFIENNKVDDISLLRADFEKQTGYDKSKVYLLTPAFRTRINWDKTVEKHKDTILIAVTVLDTVRFPINGMQVDLKNRVILKAVRNKDSKWNYSAVTFVPTNLSKGYSGLIISRSISKGIEKIDYYSEGAILNNDTGIRRKFAVRTSKSNSGLRAKCIYGYVNGMLNFVSCDNPPDITGGGSSNNDTYGDPDDFEQMPVFDEGSNEPVEQYIITNNCQNPCLKNTVDAIIMSNVQSATQEALLSAFKLNQDFNLSFYEATNLPHLRGGTATLTRYSTRPDGTFSNMDVRIDLNVNELPSASREYVAMVALHETIHAYLYTKGFFDQYGKQSVEQHDMMWSSYINVIAGYLNNTYGMDINEAKVLATDGLQNTFQSKIEDSIYKTLNNTTGIPSDRRAILATAYRSGTKGTTCK